MNKKRDFIDQKEVWKKHDVITKTDGISRVSGGHRISRVINGGTRVAKPVYITPTVRDGITRH